MNEQELIQEYATDILNSLVNWLRKYPPWLAEFVSWNDPGKTTYFGSSVGAVVIVMTHLLCIFVGLIFFGMICVLSQYVVPIIIAIILISAFFVGYYQWRKDKLNVS